VTADKGALALRVAVLKALFDRWALLDKEIRDGLTTQTVPGYLLLDDPAATENPVAWVTRSKPTKPKPAPMVTDPIAYARWVLCNRPDAIAPPEPRPVRVRSSFTAAALAAILKDGGIVDTTTGELVVPHGIEWVTKDPAKSTLSVRWEDGGPQAIAAAWADGTLTLDALPAGEA